ncbi:MAG: formyltetrahydrofolate deformylase [Hyphomonadaceae bacterium]|nr:formyltetrahydrofolate deformylase [Hyphomonadaceae bacterium]
MTETYLLTLSCPDKVGIIAAIARQMEEKDCFIARSRSFGDEETGQFFTRLAFRATREGFDPEQFCRDFQPIADALEAKFQVTSENDKLKALILVSRSAHCANALMAGARSGELAIEPVGFVSNHHILGPALSHWGVPYHQVPVTAETKADAEARLFALIEETGAELIVLARYMQVLSDAACRQLSGRCINIHHSFLPSFKGAKPYHQAHARGVKVIGATAHYVTSDLDEGPIITQVTEAVDHTHTPNDMIQIGRHLEAQALMRAVRAHAEHRIFLTGHRTVILT